jgi:hypothetical protein
METWLQETGGLRRTAPVQSPVPVAGGPRLSALQRAVLGVFLAFLALGYLTHLLPARSPPPADRPAPEAPGR